MENVLTADDLASQLTGTPDNEQSDTDSQNEGEQGQENQQEEGQTEGVEGEQLEGEEGAEQGEEPNKESSEVFLEWEADGEKIRVSQDELKNGYMRQQDYTQKTQNLARDSQTLQQRVQQEFQAVQQLATDYGQLTQIDAHLEQFKGVDWNALKQQDPLAYNTYLAEMNNLKGLRGDVVQQIEGKRQYMTQQQVQAFQQQTAEAQDHLKKVIPNFGAATLETMKKYGTNLGFSAQELAQVADKRMLQVLYEASQWRALQEKKPAIQNKVKTLPTKATKAAGSAPPAKQVQIEKQTKRLAQSGKVGDFAALLNSL
jgi:hypothetical protein